MNEAQTKHDLIEPALRKAGWGLVPESRLRLEFPITQGRIIGRFGGENRRQKALSADYVLEYKNRRIGVVEAKKRDLYYTDGVAQAKDYAERLQIRFSYATNGLKIYAIDMDTGQEMDLDNFPTPDELWALTYPQSTDLKQQEIERWKQRFHDALYADKGGTWHPRYYQRNATNRVLDAIAEEQDRILLTLATGTGKTAIAFQVVWKLFQAKWNLRRDGSRIPRVLFLADRNVLANQAFNAFNAFNVFEEEALVRISPEAIRKAGKPPKNGSLFFTIFQTFMTRVHNDQEADEMLEMAAESDADYSGDAFNFGQYPPDYFDFIVIDECHRGGANDESSWRAIMEYFSPAVQLGLTATPKRDDNVDTYRYFGEPVYSYKLKEGINDGFLTPFKVKEISSTIDSYVYTGDDETDGELEHGKEYSEDDINRKIAIKAREEYRVKQFMAMMDQRQKTLVFCATQIHAAAVRDLINQVADSKNPNYCHRVTADDGARGEQHLADFTDNEKSIPTILTTSRKLSTGVDAPEVQNIVLMRPIKSMVEFKQIIGRGTRLFDDKAHFTIYDFVEAHEHFKDPDWDGDPIEPESSGDSGEVKICGECGEKPCVCEKPIDTLCPECDNSPCVCEKQTKKLITVTLADHKIREIDSMVKTSFWSASGQPISANQFIQDLFGELPDLFTSEADLRKIWSLPDTRKQLLQTLSEKGYTDNQLKELTRLIHGEDSDLYDVLSYIAYAKDLIPRAQRAEQVKQSFSEYSPQQQEFLNFVLDQYIHNGIKDLDDDKLPDLLRIKYRAMADVKKHLGDLQSVRNLFIGFQAGLYREGSRI